MKKLITILLLAFMMAGCTDKKQQYISDLNKYVNTTERLRAVSGLIIADSRSTKEQPSFFNETYRAECEALNTSVDSLYPILLDCPKDFQSSLNDIKEIYKNLKKSEDLVRVSFLNSYEWRNDMLIENLDSMSIYSDRIKGCIYSLQTDVPQAFLENNTNTKE
jgi:hypothetical protein